MLLNGTVRLENVSEVDEASKVDPINVSSTSLYNLKFLTRPVMAGELVNVKLVRFKFDPDVCRLKRRTALVELPSPVLITPTVLYVNGDAAIVAVEPPNVVVDVTVMAADA